MQGVPQTWTTGSSERHGCWTARPPPLRGQFPAASGRSAHHPAAARHSGSLRLQPDQRVGSTRRVALVLDGPVRGQSSRSGRPSASSFFSRRFSSSSAFRLRVPWRDVSRQRRLKARHSTVKLPAAALSSAASRKSIVLCSPVPRLTTVPARSGKRLEIVRRSLPERSGDCFWPRNASVFRESARAQIVGRVFFQARPRRTSQSR